MRLVHDFGQSLEFSRPGIEQPLWRYVYGGKPKPFFHPLSTPAGHVLSLFEPSDHVWHRGLWFTFKFVNGENFWEERDGEQFGVQNTVGLPAVTHGDNESLAVRSTLRWDRPNGQTVIDEKRLFVYRPMDERSYALDFEFNLVPRVDVKLDRTPFTTWGGYGGLTFRGNRNWIKSRLLFDDNTTSDRPTPKTSKWCDLTGPLDGGYKLTGGVAMFDHPSNLRHPQPWYGGTGIGHYFNAAMLFHEPLDLAAGQSLDLKYRVIVHDHDLGYDELSRRYDAWASQSGR